MVELLARIQKSAPTQRHTHTRQTTMGGILSTAPTPEPTHDWIKDRVSKKKPSLRCPCTQPASLRGRAFLGSAHSASAVWMRILEGVLHPSQR